MTASAPHCLRSLKVGKCIIKKDPEHSEQLRAWLERLNQPWLGDGLPAASLRVLLSLLQPKRKHLTDAQKEELLAKQNNKCAECEAPLRGSKVEYHHEVPLQDCVAEQRFLALCPECHQMFTMNQGPRTENVLESSFHKSVYDALKCILGYVEVMMVI